MAKLQSTSAGISEEQYTGIQQEFADALENAYGKNKWGCVMLLAAFVCGIDSFNIKKYCVSFFVCAFVLCNLSLNFFFYVLCIEILQ